MKFIVVTACKAISEYLVEAKNKKEAEKKFWDGDCLSDKVTDYRNENVIEVREG